MDNHVTRILKLIKNEDRGRKGRKHKDPKKESELIGLIEDFYTEYQSLYAMFDHLRRESGNVGRGRNENEVSFSNSSSDSEYFSSEEFDSSSGRIENEHKEEADRIRKELETAEFEITDLKHKLASTSQEKEALNSYYMAAFSKIQEAEIINKNERIEADKREKELLAIIKAREIHGNQASTRIKNLQSQLTGLKVEVKSFCGQKRDMEAQIESKATEAKQEKEKNTGLHARISELELSLKEKDYEVSSLQEKLKDNEEYSMSKIADIMAQASNLQLEANSFHAQKAELEEKNQKMVRERNGALAQVKGLMDQVTAMQIELETLHNQKSESDQQMEKENKETSKYPVVIETLKDELAKMSMAEKRMMDEKEGFHIQVKDLELEVESLQNQKNELEELIKSKVCETNQLKEDKEGLHARNLELERALTEKEDKLSALQKKYEIKENEASTQVMNIAQVNMLQDSDSLLNKKSQLEPQIEREKQGSSKRPSQVSQNIKLKRKIADGQRIVKNSTINKTNGEHRKAKVWLQKSRLFPQAAERKMEELAEAFCKNLDDKTHLLYQRILLIERLHTENKDSYRMTQNRYEQEIRMLEEKVATYEAELRKISHKLETTNNALCGAEQVRKFDEYNSNVVSRITNMLNKLQFAKDWVTVTNSEIKRLKHNESCFAAQLENKEEQEFILRTRVWKLEAQLSKEGGEKLNLMTAISQLEKKVRKLEKNIKEKDEELSSLGEEKREAIRQLCLLIDYHRSRYDDLKELMQQMKK